MPKHDDTGRPLNHQGGHLHHSHSAAETLAMCERKYFYSYILRLVTTSSPAAEFGVVCHDLLERLCKAGAEWEPVLMEAREKIPNHTRVLEATFPNLPWVRLEGYQPWPMPPHWNSETRVYVDAFGLKLKGFIDLWTYHDIPSLDPTKKSLVISDLKVSGDPYKWGKDADQLATFGQPLKYAKAICEQEGIEVDVVHAEHIYAKRKGRAKSFVVSAKTGDIQGIPWAAVEKHWRTQVAQDSGRMLELHAIGDPEEVPASAPQACSAFGGCEFRSICPAHPDNYIPFKKNLKPTKKTVLNKPGGTKHMSALNALANLAGANPAIKKSGAKKAISRAQERLGDVPDTAKALMEGSASATAEAPTLSTEANAVLSQLRLTGSMTFADIKACVAQAQGKARVRFFAKHADALAAELGSAVTVTGAGKDIVLSLEGVVPYDEPESATEVHVTADVKARAAAKPAPLEQPPKPQPRGKQQAPSTEALSVPTVFVGCYPAWTQVKHIDELLAPLYTEVEKALNITYWRADKYGEGVKTALSMLASVSRRMAADGAPLITEDLFIPRDHPLAEGYVGLLRSLGYNRVVMG